MVSSQRDTALATVLRSSASASYTLPSFGKCGVHCGCRSRCSPSVGPWAGPPSPLAFKHSLGILCPVLIGLADNLGIHLAARIVRNAAGRDFRTAMEIAARQMGPGIVTAGSPWPWPFTPSCWRISQDLPNSDLLLGVVSCSVWWPALPCCRRCSP